MSTTETLLWFVAVPAVIVAVIWLLAYGRGPERKKRYRPGRPFQFTPVWYVADHDHPDSSSTRRTRAELERGRVRAALPTAAVPTGETQRTTGGASDRW